MSWRYSSCRSFSSPNMRSSSTSENPITAFSGVRSSCDMLARNSDLCCARPPRAARVFSSSSRNTRALWMATADWLASVSSRSTVALGERAGHAPADHQRADDLVLAQQRDGQHRAPPGSADAVDVRIGRLRARSGAWRGSPRGGGAADERLVQVDARRPQRLDQLAAGAVDVRTWNSSVSSSNSKIEPPSAPDSSTARVTIVVSTCCRSRLELTAWLVSPSALQLVNRLRQLAAALLQLLEQLHVLDRDRALLRRTS